MVIVGRLQDLCRLTVTDQAMDVAVEGSNQVVTLGGGAGREGER